MNDITPEMISKLKTNYERWVNQKSLPRSAVVAEGEFQPRIQGEMLRNSSLLGSSLWSSQVTRTKEELDIVEEAEEEEEQGSHDSGK